jgi:hypothetical protein
MATLFLTGSLGIVTCHLEYTSDAMPHGSNWPKPGLPPKLILVLLVHAH